MNYIPRKPTDEWEFQAKGVAGNFSRYDGAATVSGPIVPGIVSILLGFDYSEFDGSWRNTHPYADIDFQPRSGASGATNSRPALPRSTTFVGIWPTSPSNTPKR